MAERLIYIPFNDKKRRVKTEKIEFTWYPGYSIIQKQKSIDSLHDNARRYLRICKILEVSTKSKDEIGRRAGAFNLTFTAKNDMKSSVERFYQGSKVFKNKNGGPFTDIYQNSDYRFKSDSRLKNSGNLLHFDFIGQEWKLNEPFYDWLYINALVQNGNVRNGVSNYEAFTDIQFNHKVAYNCQAHSVALYLAIKDLKEFDDALKSKDCFIELVGKRDDQNKELIRNTENSSSSASLPLFKPSAD